MRVLLASDGSADSRRAAVWLRDAPLPSDTKVSVVTVATLTRPPSDLQTMTQLRQSAVADARETADTTAKILTGRWPVEIIATLGDPRLEIVHLAEEHRVDIVALGARGLARFKRFLLGSVSLAAARYAPCPVVIVRGEPLRVRHILIAVDGSQGSREAVQFVSIFGIANTAAVTLLHVVPNAEVPAHRPLLGSSPEEQLGGEQREERAEGEQILADAAAMLMEVGDPIKRLVVEGDAAKEIVNVARNLDVDLIALGARGLRTLGRLFLGSVSETVLHHAGRPVVIVRTR